MEIWITIGVLPRRGLSSSCNLGVEHQGIWDMAFLTGSPVLFAGMQGLGTWDGCVPVPCVVPSCPGTLPTAHWALLASRNSSDSLDIAATALEQHQQLVQSHWGHEWEPRWGSHREP